jgi:hypothetical protein
MLNRKKKLRRLQQVCEQVGEGTRANLSPPTSIYHDSSAEYRHPSTNISTSSWKHRLYVHVGLNMRMMISMLSLRAREESGDEPVVLVC